MRMRLCISLLLLLVSLPGATDCECVWRGSFADVQADTDLIISGKVIARKGNSIDVSIARILRGNEPENTVRIWLKTGDYCRPDAAAFPPQSLWVMALEEIRETIPGGFNPGTPNISYGRVGDYSLSSCGGYWLSLSENLVTGNLVQAPRWVREPKMTPVILDLVADYVSGKVDVTVLLQASREDPALRALMLDTRSFLRNEN